MHVSNLLSAVKALETFAEGAGSVAPFCMWLGDQNLFISHALDSAGITDEAGNRKPEISASQATSSVLLLVALRQKLTSVEVKKGASALNED